jgi:hypothetical protein
LLNQYLIQRIRIGEIPAQKLRGIMANLIRTFSGVLLTGYQYHRSQVKPAGTAFPEMSLNAPAVFVRKMAREVV